MGAVEFGRWLHARPGGEEDEFEVVHTVSDPQTMALAERAIEETLDAHGLTGAGIQPRIADHGDPVTALAETQAEFDAAAVIVGRRAKARSGGWPPLGRVGRRLLRSHPGPIVVVPPDWTTKHAGDGPIMVASDATADSVGALRFAARMSEAVSRPWVVAHVLSEPTPFTMYGLGGQPSETPDRRRRAREIVDEQLEGLDLSPDEVRIEQGLVLDTLLDIRDALRAPLVVTGSRRLGVLGRLFSASVGTELAAASPCPVAVVPPPARATSAAPTPS
jgi:nucleotide-binding universal stress UspA family protein